MAEKGGKIRAVKGMSDVMPPEIGFWQSIEASARSVFSTYGYSEIRTPIVEDVALFRRGVGETTSIVEKEMYSFVDQGEQSLALRPEGTASVVRAYVESGVCNVDPLARYYYMGPMFRRERPQKGRQRQFYQIGCELFDASSPYADVEMIAMADHFLKEVGATDVVLELNSIGCADCRPSFDKALAQYLSAYEGKLCEDCKRRLVRNPLRVLDCKSEPCKSVIDGAPRFSEHWCGACREHFDCVKRGLDATGVVFKENERIVRGLDYYMRTTFEFTTDKLGAQNAVLAGGRYDGLVKSLGGPDIAGIGFALGMERLVILLQQIAEHKIVEDKVYFAVLGEKAREVVLQIIQVLRKDGVRVEWDYAVKSLKSQMKRADRIGAESVVIIGDDEMSKGEAVVRNMRNGSQSHVRIKDLPMHFVANIGG
jgi:histidyl-tRNA synthetase